MAELNDGSVPTGSIVITINAVTYVAENIRSDNAAQVIQRRNEINVPSGSRFLSDFMTGSATLQLATTSTAIPGTAGDSDVNVFTAVLGVAAASATFAITKVGNVYSQGEARKIDIEFQKKIN